jgi:hypothetical protein
MQGELGLAFVEDALVTKYDRLEGSIVQQSIQDVAHGLGSSLVIHSTYSDDV